MSREKVANILLTHAGRGGEVAGAAAEVARAAARSRLAPILDTACDRLAYVLRNLFDLAAERNKNNESLNDERWKGSMDGYVGFHEVLRHSYNQFIHDLAKQCKQLVRHHLDSVTSPDSQICYYDSDSFGSSAFGATSIHRCNLFGGANDDASRTGSPYHEVCSAASQYFAKIKELLIERTLPSTLHSGFLTPCRDRLMAALGLDLFFVNDERFMDMFVAPGAVGALRNERKSLSLQKRQKILQSCLSEFKNVA